jgi:hypothetical protein
MQWLTTVMQVIVIKDKWTERILHSSEKAKDIKECLEEAVASGASLDGASLVGASLVGASLDGASLVGASLVGASLRNASLDGASLDDASLVGASLVGASLRNASLDGASLEPIQTDFFDVLLNAVPEIPQLRAALVEGRVDGSTYEGKCACLVGTIANIRDVGYGCLDGIEPDSDRPIERFFTSITKGDTPETSQFSALAVRWIDEFTAKFDAAIGARTL